MSVIETLKQKARDFQLPQWRTWSGILLIDASMIWVLILVPAEMRGGIAPTIIGAQGALALILGAKSVLEHKVNADAIVQAKPPVDAILAQKPPA